MQRPAQSPWPWQTGLQWAEWSGAGTAPTLAQLSRAQPPRFPVAKTGEPQHHSFAEACQCSAGHTAPWLPSMDMVQEPEKRAGCQPAGCARHCLCPVLPALLPAAWVEVAFFSWLAPACQLEYKGIIFL